MIISETSGPFPAMLHVFMSGNNKRFLAEVIHRDKSKLHFQSDEKWLVFRSEQTKALLYPLIQDNEMLGIKNGNILSNISGAYELALEIQESGIAVALSNFAFSRDENDPSTLNGQCECIALQDDARSLELMTALDALMSIRFKAVNAANDILSKAKKG